MQTYLNGDVVFYAGGSGQPEKGAKTIFFVHGAGMDHSVWVMPARYFARHGYRVVAFDLPGHGQSGGQALASIDGMADWLAQLMAHLRESDTQETTVVGHSMGTLISLSLAARQGEQLDRLVLLGTSSPMPVTPLLLDAARDNHHAADNPGTSNLNMGERLLERVSDGVYHADLAACNDFDASDYPPIAHPTLIMIGDQDKMTPARAGLKVASNVPGAQVLHLNNCGHSMLSEQPNAVLDGLSNFILGTADRVLEV
jgi:pimeloyl-ACP methyl ester carboxylesterase